MIQNNSKPMMDDKGIPPVGNVGRHLTTEPRHLGHPIYTLV